MRNMPIFPSDDVILVVRACAVRKKNLILQLDMENDLIIRKGPVAVFAGSFDPFTIGHKDVVDRFLPLFRRIVVGVGVNERKQYMQSAEERVEAIRKVYAGEERVRVEAYSDLTVDFARRHGAAYIIKGVRSAIDFEYERQQAEINRRLTGIETIVLFADPALSGISSSVVRELSHFGRDVTEFLP